MKEMQRNTTKHRELTHNWKKKCPIHFLWGMCWFVVLAMHTSTFPHFTAPLHRNGTIIKTLDS